MKSTWLETQGSTTSTSQEVGDREIRAAVIREKGGPFRIESLTLEAPRRHEILVRVVATGMCHTDMLARDQGYPVPHPIVLGHEGSGIVERIGDTVQKVVPGDPVVLTFMSCGHCRPCYLAKSVFCESTFPLNFGGGREDGSSALCDSEGAKVHSHFFGQSSFGTYALVNERNVVKVGKEDPLELLGPLGCGIQTGAGAVINSLKVRPGSTFAVFGAGAVGSSAVMAARVAGATIIIAVDIVPFRLELAKQLGATHVVNSRETDPVAVVRDISGGGVDFSLEASGHPESLRQAIDSLGYLGTCGIAGASPLGAEASFDINTFMLSGKRIRGILEGESVPDIFIPQLIKLKSQGRFPFEKLMKFYNLDQINTAAEDSLNGDTIKPIIRLI
jgi:aryl-alcohol dehydrogenase